MSEERQKEFEGQAENGQDDADEMAKNSAASRARNRTVMLTPEITGQVRALLNNDGDSPSRDPLSELLPPLSGPQVGVPDAPVNADYAPGEAVEEQRDPTGRLRKAAASRADLVQQGGTPSFSVNPGAAAGQSTGGTPQPARTEKPRSKIVGFLISFDKEKNGEVYDIRAGRWLLTSRPTDHGEFILVNDPTISPLHAIVRATNDGKIQILDQLSEFGTGVLRNGEGEEEEVTGSMALVTHGDVIRFGERYFVVCVVPEVELPNTSEEADEAEAEEEDGE